MARYMLHSTHHASTGLALYLLFSTLYAKTLLRIELNSFCFVVLLLGVRYCVHVNKTQTMNAQAIVETVRRHKGQHVLATWQRVAKTLKDCPMLIVKRTRAWVRAGIDYSNLTQVKEGVASGERGEVEGLKWGEWIQFPFIIKHKGLEYVRLYPATFANLATPEVEWSMDGKPATYEQVEPYLLASEKRKPDEAKPLCFTLKADDVIAIAA